MICHYQLGKEVSIFVSVTTWLHNVPPRNDTSQSSKRTSTGSYRLVDFHRWNPSEFIPLPNRVNATVENSVRKPTYHDSEEFGYFHTWGTASFPKTIPSATQTTLDVAFDPRRSSSHYLISSKSLTRSGFMSILFCSRLKGISLFSQVSLPTFMVVPAPPPFLEARIYPRHTCSATRTRVGNWRCEISARNSSAGLIGLEHRSLAHFNKSASLLKQHGNPLRKSLPRSVALSE